MSKKQTKKNIRNVVFCVLSFILALFLFVNSVCMLSVAFFLNENAWIDQMNSSNYFTDKADEIKNKLVFLGNAGGLPPEFFENVVDPIQVANDTQTYMDAYFNGRTAGVDGTAFKRKFSSELDRYITENNAKYDDNNKDYLVDNAVLIYTNGLEIPLFYKLSELFAELKGVMPFVIAGLGAGMAAIVLVLFFCNKWKHRTFKYYCYSCAGAFLSLLAVSIYMSVAGGLKNIVLESRALYDTAVSFGTSISIALWILTAFFLIIALLMYVIYSNKIRKVSATD